MLEGVIAMPTSPMAFWSDPDVAPGTTVGPNASRAEIEEDLEIAKREHDELAELAADPSEVATITSLAATTAATSLPPPPPPPPGSALTRENGANEG